MRTFVPLCATVLFIASTLRANSWSPTPDQRWELTVDHPEAVLGDDVQISLSVTNIGDKPIQIWNGFLFWRGFVLKAASDKDPQPIALPQPGVFYQGRIDPIVIPSGAKESHAFDLAHDCWIDHPGKYTIQLTTQPDDYFNTGYEKLNAANLQCSITFKQPTEDQAKYIFASAFKQQDVAAALRPMHPAIYLPMLRSLRNHASPQTYMPALSESYLRETTQFLIQIVSESSGQDCELALDALRDRIPSKDLFEMFKATDSQIAAAWQPDLAPSLQEASLKRLSSNDTNVSTPASEIFAALGPPTDPQVTIGTLNQVLRNEANPAAPAPNWYAIEALLKACTVLIKQGARAPVSPTEPADIAMYLQSLKTLPNFRPVDWQTSCVQWSASKWPTIRELSLRDQPSTLSDAMRVRLRALVIDPDQRVADVACDWVIQDKDAAAAPQVLKLLSDTDDVSLLKKAFAAAVAAGVRADALRVIVNQLPETAHSDELMLLLCDVVDHGGGSRFRSSLPLQAMADMQKVWHPWLKKHRDELNAGKVFAAGDPDLPPELFPVVFQVHLKNGEFWPTDR